MRFTLPPSSSFKSGSRSACLPFLYQTNILAPLFLQSPARSRPTSRALRRPLYRSFSSSQCWKSTDPESSSPKSNESPGTSPEESTSPGSEVSNEEALMELERQQRIEYRELARARHEREQEYAREVASYPSFKEWEASKQKTEGSYGLRHLGRTFPKSAIDQFEPDDVDFIDDNEDGFETSLGGNDRDSEDRDWEDRTEPIDMNSYRPGAPPKESTITDNERLAFNRIFSDIFQRLKDKGTASSSKKHVPLIKPDVAEGMRQTIDLVEMAVSDVDGSRRLDAAKKQELEAKGRQARRTPVSFKPAMDDDLEIEEKMRAEIEKYPPSLRPAASKALASVARRDILGSATTIQRSESTSVDRLNEVNKLEHLRNPERERVEQLMREAKTDFDLWAVMEEEVFSIIPKLESGQTPSQEGPTNQLSILGPLYPSHLLLGIRLLSTSFTQPSPLTLCILPRIKALGIISQVLGASTALYNELLRIQWLRYDNYEGVLSLLTEMQNSGLDFDRETLDVLQGIRMRARLIKGDGEGEGEVTKAVFWSKYAPLARFFNRWERSVREEVVGREENFERGLRDEFVNA